MASVSVSIPPQVYKMILISGVVVGSYLLIRKGIRQANSNAVNNDFTEDSKDGEAARFAIRLYQAMYENDYFGLTEDEEAIFKVASDMQRTNISFGLVAKKYRAKYNRDLLKNIQDSLSPTEFDKFQTLITGNLGKILIPEKIYLKSELNVYDSKFQRMIHIPFTDKSIGKLKETVLVGDNSQPFYGFENRSKMYYAPANMVILKRA